jgi:hypothetical protein
MVDSDFVKSLLEDISYPKVTPAFLDDFQERNYYSERNLNVTFSLYAEFGTDHRRGTRHQRGHSQKANGFFDSAAKLLFAKLSGNDFAIQISFIYVDQQSKLEKLPRKTGPRWLSVFH